MKKGIEVVCPNSNEEYWDIFERYSGEYDKVATGVEAHTLWKGRVMICKIDMSNLNNKVYDTNT
jgi:hypothetical protein